MTYGKNFEPTWKSLADFQVPAWYQDARFGILIHWGDYSVPAFDNRWVRTEQGLKVILPGRLPDAPAYVLRIR